MLLLLLLLLLLLFINREQQYLCPLVLVLDIRLVSRSMLSLSY